MNSTWSLAPREVETQARVPHDRSRVASVRHAIPFLSRFRHSGGAHRIRVDRAARHRHRHCGSLGLVIIIGRGLIVSLRNSCELVGFSSATLQAVIIGEICGSTDRGSLASPLTLRVVPSEEGPRACVDDFPMC
jgi:hypothetical protein